MDTVKVWRVQNVMGSGPYQSPWKLKRFLCEEHASIQTHPAAYDDFPAKNLGTFLFGFLDKKDALSWFGNYWLDQMAKYGFQLVEVEAMSASVVIGKSCRQIVFIPA